MYEIFFGAQECNPPYHPIQVLQRCPLWRLYAPFCCGGVVTAVGTLSRLSTPSLAGFKACS